MNRIFPLHWTAFLAFFLVVAVACSSPVSIVWNEGDPTAPSYIPPLATEPEETELEEPEEEEEQEPPQPEDTPIPEPTSDFVEDPTDPPPGPSCTVVQDVNLRSGPGTAYRPPIGVLAADSLITPLGFVPEGYRGGPWAFVVDPATQEEGWVSAGPEYISCNLSLDTLPSIAFDPPPPPPLPQSAQSSNADGNGFCIDTLDDIECQGIFSTNALFQFRMLRNGAELTQNDGVEYVYIQVVRGEEDVIYSTNDQTAVYCIFDGDGQCNSWASEGSTYFWPDGTPVEAGEYKLTVDTLISDGQSSHWEAYFTLTLP